MSRNMNSRYPRKKKYSCDLFVGKEILLRQSGFFINFFYFKTAFITSFKRGRYRGLQCYKQKYPSRGVPYTAYLKKKAKSLEN